MEQQVTLTCLDGTQLQVPTNVATMSQTIKALIEDAGIDNPIPIPNIAHGVLAKVIEYCKHHVDKEQQEEEEGSMVIGEWDLAFCAVDQQTLYELLLAANYLDIPGLLKLMCMTIANILKGKTPEEIRKVFGIVEQFTPEEEEIIRKENEWVEHAIN